MLIARKLICKRDTRIPSDETGILISRYQLAVEILEQTIFWPQANFHYSAIYSYRIHIFLILFSDWDFSMSDWDEAEENYNLQDHCQAAQKELEENKRYSTYLEELDRWQWLNSTIFKLDLRFDYQAIRRSNLIYSFKSTKTILSISFGSVWFTT